VAEITPNIISHDWMISLMDMPGVEALTFDEVLEQTNSLEALIIRDLLFEVGHCIQVVLGESVGTGADSVCHDQFSPSCCCIASSDSLCDMCVFSVHVLHFRFRTVNGWRTFICETMHILEQLIF